MKSFGGKIGLGWTTRFGAAVVLVFGFAMTAPAAPKDLAPEFSLPPGGVLREEVDFWVKVYGKYTSHEGVIHDSKYPTVVYGEYDFAKFHERRSRVVKREKERFKNILLRLHREGGTGWDAESKRVAELFHGIDDPAKFLNAAHYKRIRFQLGQKDRFIEGYRMSGEYLPFMEEIFIKRAMPFELTRLPFVESSFNTRARSKVGASGIWQFMKTTGGDFMMINDAVDERNDPLRATEAAAQLLKINYETLGNWPLAVTAYNHGRSSLLRATNRLGTRDLEEIILRNRVRGFGFASSNFFACLLAALEVERNPEKYFGVPVDRYRTHRFYEVQLPAPIRMKDLVSFMRLKRKEVIVLNPGLTDLAIASKRKIPKGYRLRLPNSGSGTDENLASATRVFLAGFAKIPNLYKY
ncbi:MAG: lytic transglycosylase domain-containing protein [Bdellovibrionales bacterium]|nr:lytic transglycosylase domain-containing protein [Bdellovibrionales bacterium]